MTVITRFAPSPTGMLHIGGARTALFNYLFAKHHDGKFLLRIEDTDLKRSTEEAKAAILEGMDWMGLHADAPPFFQSEQRKRHQDIATKMLDLGTAFKCYVSQEELQARRELGQTKRKTAKETDNNADKEALLAEANALLAPFRSPYRNGGSPPSADAPFTIRLRAPEDGPRTVSDAVQGNVTIQASELDDLILLRADGTPTYMLAVVVDDHDMGVTHIIRGDDHLRNSFRQIPIYEGMGWEIPVFAHIPLIHGPDGAKLSKRHGALSTLAYRDKGYLPEAMRAYLLRLGWSAGDKEIFSDAEAVAAFDLDGINKAPARLDLDRLGGVNSHFIRQRSNEDIFDMLLPIFEEKTELTQKKSSRVRAAIPHMKDRGETIPQLAESFAFLLTERPLELNKRARKSLKGDVVSRLISLREKLIEIETWETTCISDAIGLYCAAQNLSMGQVGPPLRAALTGGLPAPDLAPVMEWFGKEEVLARMEDQIAAAENAQRNM